MKHIYFDIETTGLEPAYGSRITCICAKDEDGLLFSESKESERDIIKDFVDWLFTRDSKDYKLVSKNGRNFDVPFIFIRAATWEMFNYVKAIERYLHFDLQAITHKWIGLDDMAKLYGLKTGKNGSGLFAIELWDQRRIPELLSYCKNDVEV